MKDKTLQGSENVTVDCIYGVCPKYTAQFIKSVVEILNYKHHYFYCL